MAAHFLSPRLLHDCAELFETGRVSGPVASDEMFGKFMLNLDKLNAGLSSGRIFNGRYSFIRFWRGIGSYCLCGILDAVERER